MTAPQHNRSMTTPCFVPLISPSLRSPLLLPQAIIAPSTPSRTTAGITALATVCPPAPRKARPSATFTLHRAEDVSSAVRTSPFTSAVCLSSTELDEVDVENNDDADDGEMHSADAEMFAFDEDLDEIMIEDQDRRLMMQGLSSAEPQ